LAFTWFGRAAQDNNAHGQYALGKCYLKGIGVAANQTLVEWAGILSHWAILLSLRNHPCVDMP